ncbi:MAG: cation-translocating P-type ATPase [Mailhella sp.]|nr:cation-translocating P-type ATPase [Mailhella sp.]
MKDEHLNKLGLILISAISLVLSYFHLTSFPFDPAWAAIILCGVPVLCEACIGLVTRFDIKADVLVAIALIASVIIGEDFAAGEVAVIMQIGSLLEEMTVARSQAGIEKLVKLTPQKARLLLDGETREIPAQDVKCGAYIRVLPGEIIPADGIIIAGTTSVSESVMTGEPMPVDKTEGDAVLSGTTNMIGSVDILVKKDGQDSSINRMVRLVQSADAGRAKIVALADRWATWVVMAALASAAVAWWCTGDIIRAVTILVVFCPCSLVLATPTAVTAAIGNAAKHHFLVREGDALERLAQVKKVCFDKTGTLTLGKPKVYAVKSVAGIAEKDVYRWTASAETRSEHPLGKAIAESYKIDSGTAAADPEYFEMLPGKGIMAVAEGRKILVGTRRFLEEQGYDCASLQMLAAPYADAGYSVTYVVADGAEAGIVVLADELRPEVSKTVSETVMAGCLPVLLSGDQHNAARHMAGLAGIEEIKSGCLPEDKLAYIQSAERSGQYACMIGDGINDAPALKAAHVGIAMGGVGSDIACDAASIVLVKDDIKEFPHLLLLAQRMMRVIRWNLTFSMVLNGVAIVLAMAAVLNPVSGALVHNAGSVFVIVNSAFLLTWKRPS